MLGKVILPLAALALGMCLFPAHLFAQQQLKFSYGLYERVRHEYWNNNIDMSNQNETLSTRGGDRNFFRFKTSVWGQADYTDTYTLYAKLTNEIKSYLYLGRSRDKGARADWDEVVFDNLFIDAKKPAELPVSFRLGRQDLLNQYGENFLIADGTPVDGSRTFYFNALKASWTVDDKNNLDLVYINDPRTDIWLPVINRNRNTFQTPTAVEYSDAAAFIVDLKNKSVENLLLEPYYIYKHEGGVGPGGGLMTFPGEINTVGGFAKYAIAPWTLHFQLADQFGTYGDNDRQALGGYAFIDREFKQTVFSPVWTVGYVYLSGDDKNTARNEGWDPLFCRYPIWSEIYAQEFTGESGNSYWTNLSMYRTQVLLTLTKQAKFALIYSYLRANELPTANAAASISGTGKNRGSLYQAKLDYMFNKNFNSYILAEYFKPDNFYTNDPDPAIFTRVQLEIKF
ncbi:MAG: alginate export family protein [Deltaproteobacteria bacterium]